MLRRNPIDELVERVTSETLTNEDWNGILALCELVTRNETGARDCANSLAKRFTHRNPNVINLAIGVTNAVIKNCRIVFQREVAKPAFLNPLLKLVNDRTTNMITRDKILSFFQENVSEFEGDPSLIAFIREYENLKRQGVSFPADPTKPSKSAQLQQEEEEQYQLALALSLSENESKKKMTSTYSSNNNSTSTSSSTEKASDALCVVQALFDFDAEEKGELGFKKGNIIEVTKKPHTSWWEGRLKDKPSQVGLFPSNRVGDLKSSNSSPSKASTNINEDDINGANISLLLNMLSAIDPKKDNIAKNEAIQELYQEGQQIQPKLTELISEYETKKNELIELHEIFLKAKTTYDRLLKAPSSNLRTQEIRTPSYPPINDYQPNQPPVQSNQYSNQYPKYSTSDYSNQPPKQNLNQIPPQYSQVPNHQSNQIIEQYSTQEYQGPNQPLPPPQQQQQQYSNLPPNQYSNPPSNQNYDQYSSPQPSNQISNQPLQQQYPPHIPNSNQPPINQSSQQYPNQIPNQPPINQFSPQASNKPIEQYSPQPLDQYSNSPSNQAYDQYSNQYSNQPQNQNQSQSQLPNQPSDQYSNQLSNQFSHSLSDPSINKVSNQPIQYPNQPPPQYQPPPPQNQSYPIYPNQEYYPPNQNPFPNSNHSSSTPALYQQGNINYSGPQQSNSEPSLIDLS